MQTKPAIPTQLRPHIQLVKADVLSNSALFSGSTPGRYYFLQLPFANRSDLGLFMTEYDLDDAFSERPYVLRGRTLAVASDSSIAVFKENHKIGTVKVNDDSEVFDVSRDGKFVVHVQGKRIINLWDVQGGKCLASFEDQSDVHNVAMNPWSGDIAWLTSEGLRFERPGR